MITAPKLHITIGATRCYNPGEHAEWFRELTVNGILYLVPLDQQDDARHALAAALAPPSGEGVE